MKDGIVFELQICHFEFDAAVLGCDEAIIFGLTTTLRVEDGGVED